MKLLSFFSIISLVCAQKDDITLPRPQAQLRGASNHGLDSDNVVTVFSREKHSFEDLFLMADIASKKGLRGPVAITELTDCSPDEQRHKIAQTPEKTIILEYISMLDDDK